MFVVTATELGTDVPRLRSRKRRRQGSVKKRGCTWAPLLASSGSSLGSLRCVEPSRSLPSCCSAVFRRRPPACRRRRLPAALVFQPGTAPLQLKHLYRGSMQVDVVSGKLRAIIVVGLEQYLYGVVPSEMPYTWAPEALKAQAVVARSYALATRKSGAFDLYPDTRSQVYLGVEHEKASSTAAVDGTAGQVVLYQGAVAKTV